MVESVHVLLSLGSVQGNDVVEVAIGEEEFPRHVGEELIGYMLLEFSVAATQNGLCFRAFSDAFSLQGGRYPRTNTALYAV